MGTQAKITETEATRVFGQCRYYVRVRYGI